MKEIPIKQPEVEVPYRLAIISDWPEEIDEALLSPFNGPFGNILQNAAAHCQLMVTACFRAYAAPWLPINPWGWGPNSQWVQAHKGFLRKALQEFNPNCILLIDRSKSKLLLELAGIKHPISSYRGSVFKCEEMDSPFYGFKCVATYHPHDIMKGFDDLPLFAFDVARAKEEAMTPELPYRDRKIEVELTCNQVIERLNSIKDGTLTSIDIEGGVSRSNKEISQITCISFSTDPDYAFVVAPHDYADAEKLRLFRALSRVISNPKIPKVLQNSLYDNFCLSWQWKMPILGLEWDTMLSGWELYPELPKGLGVQASIYTKEPYYKFERKVTDKLTHLRYCGKDAAVTLEIALKHKELMKPHQLEHFRLNMKLLPIALYMELRGIKYDYEKAKERAMNIEHEQHLLQLQINKLAGQELNPNSPKQMVNVIYKKLGFKPQYAMEAGRKTTKLTADAGALLNLLREPNSEIIHTILSWRALEGQRKQLIIEPDTDGRVRNSYNIVGTETGRFSSSASPTDSGTNLQTIMKVNRDLYVGDPDCYIFQCDLSGADGWTVAAHCAACGDPTMLEDYYAGIKPAIVIAAMYKHGSKIATMPRDELKPFLKEFKKSYLDTDGAWLYFVCKMIQHGSNYGMKERTMASNILKQSWKKQGQPIYVSAAECRTLQSYYLDFRYRGVKIWWSRIQTELKKSRTLPSASGHVRTFFGNPNHETTLKAALAHEPQINTTYATSLAALRLWEDPLNRRPDGSLIIEPLHQVHDALIGQFPKSAEKFAVERIRTYFYNPIRIAGIELVIPFEGAYGENWKAEQYTI